MQPMPHHQPRAVEGYTTPPGPLLDGEHCGRNSVSHSLSPTALQPKNVAFELLLDENPKVRARIPMRVQIFPHDTTDSIVTTVKNFYGIYDGAASGVSFEDETGTTLIARYENLRNNMTVYVRVIPVHTYNDDYGERYYGASPINERKRPSLGEPIQMVANQPPQFHDYVRPPSRPVSRVARNRSISPSNGSRRSVSQNKGRGGNKSRGSSAHGSLADDGIAGFSDSDGGQGSISGSRKARSDQFASADISMDNILQDGRRKRPKFDSSELPLFAPPQVPLTTSISSTSPQRRSTGQEGEPSPFARPTQRPYNVRPPLPSPQSFGFNDQIHFNQLGRNSLYATPVVPDHGHRLRDRPIMQPVGQYPAMSNRPSGPGILPTPDPTIASCISDEDVAMQLIRLGDASNFSHGRHSASTLDDAFSGAADASSSTGATSDGGEYSEDEDDNELPPRSRQRIESSPLLPPGHIKRTHKQLDDILPSFDSTEVSGNEDEVDYRLDSQIKSEYDEDTLYPESAPKAKKPKTKSSDSSSKKIRQTRPLAIDPSKPSKSRPANGPRKLKNGSNSTTTSATTTTIPGVDQVVSPTTQHVNISAPSRKTSGTSVNFQHQLAADEEDLSTKPRCQRCRKSKKGCDRQRPCQRCKDAGIGLEGCISEDEGNGRKGRYGRHMGVPVKKTTDSTPIVPDALPTTAGSDILPGVPSQTEKNKKRKR